MGPESGVTRAAARVQPCKCRIERHRVQKLERTESHGPESGVTRAAAVTVTFGSPRACQWPWPGPPGRGRPATPLARGQSPASHGRLGSAAQVYVSLFDHGGMTGHSAVSVMVMAR